MTEYEPETPIQAATPQCNDPLASDSAVIDSTPFYTRLLLLHISAISDLCIFRERLVAEDGVAMMEVVNDVICTSISWSVPNREPGPLDFNPILASIPHNW
ncbi:unnamed protein product [Vicia faba]|uniref:Uncharacterized protein n=1 Tax=Vicia faba TaxID=3906 RepID=A0AAV1B1V0_VICFA|nr:unnamed protein product [Vicia faba]